MKRLMIVIGLVILLLVGAGMGYFYGRRSTPDLKEAPEKGKEEEAKPVAKVKVASLEKKKIEEDLVVYGTVTPAPGAAHTLSMPYECRVKKVIVTAGQLIKNDDDLIEIEPGPDAALELKQARAELDASGKDLKLMKDRFEMKLVAQQDLIAADQRNRNAQLLVASLESRGIGKQGVLKSQAAGVVSAIEVQQGQIIPAGGPLLEMVAEDQIMVRLGVEDEDKDFLEQGESIGIYGVNAPTNEKMEGHISMIGRQLNPATRLVDVFVSLPAHTKLLLNSYVRGVARISSATGLVAPRAAVLPVEGEYVMYTVENGRAKKNLVKLGLKNDQEVQVIAEGLKEGLAIVILGNAELEDGMAVEVESGK
jgi:RND family efflux transporter MFP subunit